MGQSGMVKKLPSFNFYQFHIIYSTPVTRKGTCSLWWKVSEHSIDYFENRSLIFRSTNRSWCYDEALSSRSIKQFSRRKKIYSRQSCNWKTSSLGSEIFRTQRGNLATSRNYFSFTSAKMSFVNLLIRETIYFLKLISQNLFAQSDEINYSGWIDNYYRNQFEFLNNWIEAARLNAKSGTEIKSHFLSSVYTFWFDVLYYKESARRE